MIHAHVEVGKNIRNVVENRIRIIFSAKRQIQDYNGFVLAFFATEKLVDIVTTSL